MIEILNAPRYPRARAAGALVADILQELRRRAVPGVNLLELDAVAESMIKQAGGASCYVDYDPSFGRGPFGHYVCTSVNDAVLHGLPHDYVLLDGDLLSLDLAVQLEGVVADSAVTHVVGTGSTPEKEKLIEVTQRALAAAIAVAGPSARIGDLAHAIGTVLTAEGYEVNTDFGGHGVGTTMHQDPHVPNIGRPGRGYKLRPGLLLALEPWVMTDTAELVTDDDGWTLRSATGCLTAHAEHTVLITEDGAEIMTLPSGS